MGPLSALILLLNAFFLKNCYFSFCYECIKFTQNCCEHFYNEAVLGSNFYTKIGQIPHPPHTHLNSLCSPPSNHYLIRDHALYNGAAQYRTPLYSLPLTKFCLCCIKTWSLLKSLALSLLVNITNCSECQTPKCMGNCPSVSSYNETRKPEREVSNKRNAVCVALYSIIFPPCVTGLYH